MKEVQLAARKSTVLWQGDVVIVGGTLAGLSAAAACASSGRKTCLIEAGPTLGTELSRQWCNQLPAGELGAELTRLAVALGAPDAGVADIVLTTVACDQLLEQAGVRAFVNIRAVRTRSGADGLLDGVEVVGKSGRQAVRAPLVLDATPGRKFTAGLTSRAGPPLEAVVRRIYVSGIHVPAEGMVWTLPDDVGTRDGKVSAVRAAWEGEGILTVAVPGTAEDSQGILFARSAGVAIRAVSCLRRRFGLADLSLVDLSPELVPVAAVPPSGADSCVGPAGSGLYVLPQDPDRGRELALAAALVPDLAPASRPLGGPTPIDLEDLPATGELAAANEQDLQGILLEPAPARLHEPRDVVVVGYGTGGAFAALAAAEEGVRVAVLDPAGTPGGIGTAGRIHSYYHGFSNPMQDRLDERTADDGQTISPGVVGYHPVAKAHSLIRAFGAAGVEVFAGHRAFGVVCEEGKVTGVLTAAESGYHVFPCQVVIDGTGDGDMAAAAGAPTRLGREGDGFPQPYSYTPTLMRDGRLRHHNYDAGWVDPTDATDLSRAHFEGRRRIREGGPYTQENHYCTLAPVIGIRESRFIESATPLSFTDFLDGRTHPDAVCSARAHYDNHAMDYAEESEWGRRHVVMFGLWRFLHHGQIPYRSLLPTGVEGLLMACRALGVDHDLHQLLRMQRDLQALGEVCGTAAALAVKGGRSPAALDWAEFRAALVRRGVQPRPAEKVADVPVEELFDRLGDDTERGIAMWRLSRLRPDARRWEAFFAGQEDPEVRFAGAVAAALGGRGTEAVRSILARALAERWDEPRLGVKSPSRFVVAALALAELRTEGIAQTLARLLEEENLPPPDALLLLRSLGTVGDPAGVEPVKRFLYTLADRECSTRLWGVSSGIPESFRFALEIRAVRTLGRLGCSEENERLRPYLRHSNLLIRRHARRVAREVGLI